jgi:hypothetical protein
LVHAVCQLVAHLDARSLPLAGEIACPQSGTVTRLSAVGRSRPLRGLSREIPPIGRAALAAEGKKPRVALVCREGETAAALLERLDAELGKAMATDTVVDEVLPEIKRRRTR